MTIAVDLGCEATKQTNKQKCHIHDKILNLLLELSNITDFLHSVFYMITHDIIFRGFIYITLFKFSFWEVYCRKQYMVRNLV